MIKVHKIEVENIRSLGHAVFEPLVDGGITAVNGPNGAGKSSLLVALIWAIYGVTPDGVVRQAMRRQGSEGTCRVVVEFECNDQMVTVERGLKGRNDAAYLLVHVNGYPQAKTPSEGTKYLLSLLGGLDAEGFMTAFVIRQKELDGLVKAKPSERRKLIERLAGIDRMSAAVKSAREEETEVKKRLELLPGNPEAVQAARDALEQAQQRAVELWEVYETAAADVDTRQAAFTAAEDAARRMQERLDASAAADRETARCERDLAVATERHQAVVRETEQTLDAARGGSPEEVEAAQTAFDAANAALQANQRAREGADRAVTTARQDTERATQARARATRAHDAASQAQTAAEQAAQHAAGFPGDLDDQIARTEIELSTVNETVGSLRGEYERLSASIKAMEGTDGTDPHCPTCAAVLADPTVVVTALKETRARVAVDGKAAGEHVKELETLLAGLREQARQANDAATAARHSAAQATAAAQAAGDAETDAIQWEAIAAQSQATAEVAKAEALSAAQQTEPLTRRVEQTAEVLRVAQVAAAAAARVPDLQKAAQEAADQVETAQKDHTAALAAQASARVDDDEKNTVMAAYQAAQQALAHAETAKVQANGNFRVAEEQTRSAEKTRDAEETRMRARAEAHALLEQKTAVREALDFFRKDRIASLAPELSEIATEQIPKMTDGKFIAVELDEEFTPVVTDAQGRQRPASWLSGGEESAVALALRLAIGEVIAGTQGGLLWMDEPQTAMDAARRPAMMSVIRDLHGRQPIIISHVTEATDMVDHVVEVIPDEDNGSAVVAVNPTSEVDEHMLDALDAQPV